MMKKHSKSHEDNRGTSNNSSRSIHGDIAFAGNDLKSSENNIEIWEDLVNIRDLVKALVISILTTFCGYYLSPNDSYKPLLFGLAGAIVGFIISSFLIEPKREFIEEK